MRRVPAAARTMGAYSGNLLVYVLVGGTSALVEWAVFASALKLVAYVPAALAGFAVATFVNYMLSRRFNFERRGISSTEELARTYVVSSLALVVNLAAMVALVELYGLHPMIGKIAGTGCAFLLNFAGRQFWVFAATPRHRLAALLRRRP